MKETEQEFLHFLGKDEIPHIFVICNPRRIREKAQVWRTLPEKQRTDSFSDLESAKER